MKRISGLLLLAAFAVSQLAWADPSADELLKTSDRSRGGLLKGLSWDVSIESHEDGNVSTRAFEVKARDVNALVVATNPPRNKGEIFLFNDHDLWFVKPGLRKPVAISARERLTGQAANGDIASTHYSRDYGATVEGKGKVGTQAVYVLKLKAKDPKVTYDQIRYSVAQGSKLALKAEFLNLQGETLKVAVFEYNNKIRSGSDTLPFVSKMTITDAHFPENFSVVSYAKPVEREFPASTFNVNNVVR